jgi:hypothetical protein
MAKAYTNKGKKTKAVKRSPVRNRAKTRTNRKKK